MSDSLSSLGAVSNNLLAASVGRFETEMERSLENQFDSLSRKVRCCFEIIRQWWEKDNYPMSTVMYLRFARFSKFNVWDALKAMKMFDTRSLTLTVTKLEAQLKTETLFPAPGLKSIDGLDMFYFRPSRFVPDATRVQAIIDNLAYVMSTIVEKEHASVNGIGCLAYMNNCTRANFSVEYSFQFMKMLQGRVPARVCLLLIVNPPVWFCKMWKLMMTPVVNHNLRVAIIPESKLPMYLASGYEEFLPDDVLTGRASTSKIVDDFIAYRKHLEVKKGNHSLLEARESSWRSVANFF